LQGFKQQRGCTLGLTVTETWTCWVITPLNTETDK
jgi:hypothetical protein